MNEDDFKNTQRLLEEQGFLISEARFHGEAFGSWYIYCDTLPRFGIIWDGKDRWIYVRRETQRIFAGMHEWDDLWVGRQPIEQTPAAAVDKLREFADKSTPLSPS